MDNQTLFSTIQDLIDSRQLAVRCTQKHGHPYASLVVMAITPKLNRIVFLTLITTREHDHLRARPNAAFLVNNSENRTEDICQAAAVVEERRACWSTAPSSPGNTVCPAFRARTGS